MRFCSPHWLRSIFDGRRRFCWVLSLIASCSLSAAAAREDSILELLTAEVQLQRLDYDGGFERYLAEARAQQDPTVVRFAAELAVQLDRPERVELVAMWSRVQPNAARPHQLMAVNYEAEGDWQAALQSWGRARQLGDTSSLDEWLRLLREAPTLEQEDALARVRVWRRRLAEDAEFARCEATLLALLDRQDEALAVLNRFPNQSDAGATATINVLVMLERYEHAEGLVNARVEQGGDERTWRMLLAEQLMEHAQWQHARGQVALLLQHYRDDAELPATLAYLCLQQGDTDCVRGLRRQLLARADTRDLGWIYLAQAEEQDAQPALAMNHYKQVRAGEHYLLARTRIAQMLAKLGRWNEARRELSALRAGVAEESTRLWLQEAELAKEALDLPTAITVLNDALAENDGDVDLLYARAMYRLSAEGLPGMEEDLRAVLRIDPQHVAALNGWGYVLADRAVRLNEARRMITKAYQLAPDDAAVIDSMGWLEYRLGNKKQALRFLERAWDARPDAEVAAHLGEVRWELGDSAGARAVWSEGLVLDPEHKTLLDVMARYVKASTLDRAGNE